MLSHTAQSSGDVDEKDYGFNVRNKGRRIATGVRFQILKISFKHGQETEFTNLPDVALNLETYGGTDAKHGSVEITLVPKAAATIGLASWREDIGTVRPLAHNIFEYYDDMTQNADEFRFDVVAFDNNGHFATDTITVGKRLAPEATRD